MKRLLLFALLLALLVAIVPQTVAAQGPTVPYRVGIFSDLKTTNYWSRLGPNNSVWQAYVMEPQRLQLYETSDKNFQIIPQVAVNLDAKRVKEGDKTTITVELKKGIKWSDGTELTAADVAFTGNTAIELELTGNAATIWDREYLEKIEAVDDYHAKFIFKKEPGLAIWEWGAGQAPILQAKFWQPAVDAAKKVIAGMTKPADNASDADKAKWTEALGNAQQALYNYDANAEPLAGYFTFSKWEKGAFAENTANPNVFDAGSEVMVYPQGYVEKKGTEEYKQGDVTGEPIVHYTIGPNVASAVFTLYSTQDAAILALKKGEIDFMLNPLGLQRGLMNQVSNQPGIHVITNPTNGFRYLSFNVRKPPMSDKVFRQAFACMINKEFITNNVLQGVAFPLYTEVPEANGFWYNPNVNLGCKGKTDEERINTAIDMLEKAGYKWEGGNKPKWDPDNRRVVQGGKLLMPDGSAIPNLTLIAPSAGYDPLRSSFAIWIERYAQDLGVPLKAELIGFNELITRVYEDPDYATKLDMYILGWSLTIFPDYLYDFHGSRFAGPGDNNAGGFSNAKLDELGEQLKSCLTLDECKKIAADLQVLISDELPYVVLFDTGIVETYRESLSYPYTETLSGLQYINGLPQAVKAAK